MKRFNFFGKEKGENEKNLVPFSQGLMQLDDVFSSFFKDAFDIGFGLWDAPKKMALDVYEKGKNVVVKADLPGLDKKDIQISLDDGILRISADKKAEKEVKKENGYYHLERAYGRIERAVRLPRNLKESDIKASYQNGVLKIEIPRSENEPPKDQKIDI